MPGTGGGGGGGAGGGGGMGGQGGGVVPGTGGHGLGAMGSCFEIFPSFENAASDASPLVFHRNPLELNLGSVPVGSTAKVHVSYFNFCADMEARLLGVDLLVSQAPGVAGPNFAITATTPAVGELIGSNGTFDVTFTPKTAGLLEATVRYRVSHGYYETHIKGGK